jgi:hypothetical protein
MAYIFQILCLHTCLINYLGLEEHHLISKMIVYTLQILDDYIWVLGRDAKHDSYLSEFGGVLLHTLLFPLLQVIPMDPLVFYIPNRQ